MSSILISCESKLEMDLSTQSDWKELKLGAGIEPVWKTRSWPAFTGAEIPTFCCNWLLGKILCTEQGQQLQCHKLSKFQSLDSEGYLVVVVDIGQGMVMAFGFLCCHLAPSYCSSFVFALLLLRASSVKHRSYESFGRRGSGMFIGMLPGMSTSGRCPAWSSGRCLAWSSEALLRHVL